MKRNNTSTRLNFGITFIILLSFIIFVQCENGSKSSSEKERNTIQHDTIVDSLTPTVIDSLPKDTDSIAGDPAWMGPFLMINYNDAAVLIENHAFGDTLPLEEHVNWAKDYLGSDTLYSIGRNGTQKQQFKYAIAKNPYGDCNRQVVLVLEKPEKRGFLISKDFPKTDSIQFFDHQKEGKSYFVQNEKDSSFYATVFGKNMEFDKFDSYSYFITGNNDFIIQKRGNATRMYNEGLDEEHFFYYNDEYRIARKTKSGWELSDWTPCLENANAPSPLMACFSQNEIILVWGFSEGMGDYQLYTSHIDLSDEKLSFENGNAMQAYISLGCD